MWFDVRRFFSRGHNQMFSDEFRAQIGEFAAGNIIKITDKNIIRHVTDVFYVPFFIGLI